MEKGDFTKYHVIKPATIHYTGILLTDSLIANCSVDKTDKGHSTSKEKDNIHKKFSLGGKKLNPKKGKGFGFKVIYRY